jgi:hypothetical protein
VGEDIFLVSLYGPWYGDIVPLSLDIFLVSSSDPWYGDIVLYLQTLKFPQHHSRDDQRIRYQKHGHSSPYYPQANGQLEAVNKSLKTILQKIVSQHKSGWHIMLYPTQIRLAHHAISHTLGILNLGQDCHRIFPFPISTWCGIDITH